MFRGLGHQGAPLFSLLQSADLLSILPLSHVQPQMGAETGSSSFLGCSPSGCPSGFFWTPGPSTEHAQYPREDKACSPLSWGLYLVLKGGTNFHKLIPLSNISTFKKDPPSPPFCLPKQSSILKITTGKKSQELDLGEKIMRVSE